MKKKKYNSKKAADSSGGPVSLSLGSGNGAVQPVSHLFGHLLQFHGVQSDEGAEV